MRAPISLLPDDATRTFRVLLDTLARPGQLARIDRVLLGDAPGSAVLAATLIDLETSVVVLGDAGVGDRLCRGTGARPASTIERADVVVALDGIDEDDLVRARRGTSLAPEDGARLFVEVASLHAVTAQQRPPERATQIWLTGPGAGRGRRCAIVGPSCRWFETLAAVNADHPAGVDTWFVDPSGSLMAIPRSASIDVVADISSSREAR